MSKRYSSSRFLIQHVRNYLTCGIISISISLAMLAHAGAPIPHSSQHDDTTEHPVGTTVQKPLASTAPEDYRKSGVDFDPAFLSGDAQNMDISNFKYGNPVLPGEYNVDIYVNKLWFGKRRLFFKARDHKQNAITCFNEKQLLEFGVKKDVLAQHSAAQNADCLYIEQWVEHAFYDFDTTHLRVDISIPQVALQQNAQGYVDPSVWDRGINAAFLSYSGSTYKILNRNSPSQQESTNAFMSINAGLNLAGWQLRHNGQWRWQDHPQNNQSQSDYQSNSTYLQRTFPQFRGVITLGDSFSNGEIFDSFGYRGIDFSSDDRMLPNSMSGYAPQIRGNAKTNAKVEIRQQGQLLYQSSVAPGNFEINDLYPTGFGGELEVNIIETTGEIQRFTVPYASVVQMLRPGMNRYAITVGQFQEHNTDLKPGLVQAKYQHGFNNSLTGYAGVQATENYRAYLLGAAVATPVGAFSMDATSSNADFDLQGSKSGQSYKISYSKLISPTNTNLTLAAYRYSTKDFYKLRDAIMVRDLEDKGVNTFGYGKQRSEFQITLNQRLSEKWGNIYLVGSWVDYWDRNETNKQYQIGYSNNYHMLTYGLSASKRQLEYGYMQSKSDTEYLMTLSFPIDFKRHSINVNTVTTQQSQNIGISAAVNERFNYGASISHEDSFTPAFNANARYRSNFLTIGGAYSIADNYQQAMLSASGNVVAHAGGVLFGADQGQTMALVFAPDAAGAKVNNVSGLTVNKSGYAVIPYLTPYRLNDVTLDPQGMSSRVELEESSQRIAPYAGAITKVNFSTKSGYAIYIHSQKADGGTLPFSASVLNQKNEAVGIVAQGSMVYLRTPLTQDVLTVKWGDDSAQQCQVEYDVSQQTQDKKQDMFMTEAICK